MNTFSLHIIVSKRELKDVRDVLNFFKQNLEITVHQLLMTLRLFCAFYSNVIHVQTLAVFPN